MLLTQSSQNALSSNMLIYFMYGGLIVFFINKLFKANKAKSELKGTVTGFSKNPSGFMTIMALLILGFGFFSIYMKEYISGILMIVLVLVIYLEYTSKNLFAENGFIAESKFVEWSQVKKWAFDAQKGELVVRYKKEFEEKTTYMRLEPAKIKEVDELFRKYKLKK